VHEKLDVPCATVLAQLSGPEKSMTDLEALPGISRMLAAELRTVHGRD
jgi:hypothetical protein